MTQKDMIESLNNAWLALVRRMREAPEAHIQTAMNMVGRMVTVLEAEVRKNGEQITIDEWLEVIKDECA